MTLPLLTQSKFSDEYEGFRAARVKTSAEADVIELELKAKGISYHTKIVKHKKRGREFLILLVNEHVG